MTAMMANGIYLPGTGIHTRRKRGGEVAEGTQVRLARAKENAQGDQYVSVRLLDVNGNETGDPFDVTGLIVGAGAVTALNECVPRIANTDTVAVFLGQDDEWYFTTMFQPVIECICTEPE